jgi:TrmH family RNA methyltransferase
MMAHTISSVKNPRVKSALRLRDRRGREKQQRTIIDGSREITRALESGLRVVEFFVCPPLCLSDESRAALRLAESRGAEILEVGEAVFGKLAFGERAEGIVAVAEIPRTTLHELKLPAAPLIAVVEDVEKPGNLGAILRTADGAGVDAVIVVGRGTDLFNPATIRASLGCVFTIPVGAATPEEALAWIRAHGLRIFAARVDGAIDYTQADFTGPTAIVLGSEAEGLGAAWQGDEMTPICLPMRGAADSLNVSATAAVLFYEALRQREGSGSVRSGGVGE